MKLLSRVVWSEGMHLAQHHFQVATLGTTLSWYGELIDQLSPRAAIEQHMIGVTGNQIASWLLDNWSMPDEVVVAQTVQEVTADVALQNALVVLFADEGVRQRQHGGRRHARRLNASPPGRGRSRRTRAGR